MTDETPSNLPSETAAPIPSAGPATPAAAAGWYPDATTGRQRYWDGTNWTEHFAAAAAPVRHATAPLVLGIIGLVLAFIPGALYVGIILGILALVLGVIALRAKTPRAAGGLTLGIVAIVVASLFATVYGGSNASTKAHDADASSSIVSPKTSAKAPAVAASPSPTSSPKSQLPPPTVSQAQAIISATGYLEDGQGFSKYSLTGQLTSKYGSGFSESDAEYAIKSLQPDWNAQAVIAAKGYASDGQGFSHNALLHQLTSRYGAGFTKSQADYALAKIGL